MGNWLKTIGLLTLAASVSIAVPKKVKLSADDIRKVLRNDVESNMVVVETHDGEKYRLRISTQQLENLKLTIAERARKKRLVKEAAATTTQTNTTSTTTETVAPEKTSPWSFSYTNWVISNVDKFHGGEAEFSILHLPALGYKINEDYGASFHPNTIMIYNTVDGSTSHDLLGFQIRGTKPSTPFIWDTDLFLQLRYYLPTGETFKNSDSLGALRLQAKATKKINSTWSAYLEVNPRYYLNTVASTIDEDGLGRQIGAATANEAFRFEHNWGFKIKLNDTFTLHPDIGLSHRWSLEDPEVGAKGGLTTLLNWAAGVSIAATDWLSFEPYLVQEAPLSGDKSFSLFETEQMSYWLFTTVTFL